MDKGFQFLDESLGISQLFNSLAQLQTAMMNLGVNHRKTTQYSFDKFHTLPEAQQMAIVDMIHKYIRILQLGRGSSSEADRLKAAAREFGMEVVDPNIFEALSDGDVIEIYNSDGRQIYRNLMFCKLTSYSLVDVAVNSWQELYERPMASLESIQNQVIEQMSTEALTQSYRVEDHILCEKFIYSRKKKTFLIQMKFISPLVDLQTGRRSGVISTCRLKTIADPGKGEGIFIF